MCLILCVITYTFLTFIRGDNIRLVLAWTALVDGHGGPVLEQLVMLPPHGHNDAERYEGQARAHRNEHGQYGLCTGPAGATATAGLPARVRYHHVSQGRVTRRKRMQGHRFASAASVRRVQRHNVALAGHEAAHVEVRARSALIGAQGLAGVGAAHHKVEGLGQAAVEAGAATHGESGEGLAVNCAVVHGVRLSYCWTCLLQCE